MGRRRKGQRHRQIIKNIDPRFFKVFTMPAAPTEEEARKPFLYRFFEKIPEAGKFTLLDSGWMNQIMEEKLSGALDDKTYAQRVDSVKRFERTLTDNGYLVLKFFFHISKKEQASRIQRLQADKDTAWRVSKGDLWQNHHYDDCLEAFDRYLDDTNTPSAPWYVIDSKSKNSRSCRCWRPCAWALTPPCTTRAWRCPCCKRLPPYQDAQAAGRPPGGQDPGRGGGHRGG